jgi:hypothetical protein
MNEPESLPQDRRRKVRRDKGTRLLTDRDLWVFRWIGEQYCIRFDQLRELLSREPLHRNQARAPGPNGLQNTAVDRVIARWTQEPAYVEYQRVHRSTPGWIWLTSHAERALELPYARHIVRESRFTHRYYVNLVRLDYEKRHPEHTWRSERTLLAQLPRREEGVAVPHMPDGEVWVASDKAIAVEIELSPKSDQDMDEILAELLAGDHPRYRAVWYFVSDADPVHVQAWRIVVQAQKRLSPLLRSRLKIIDVAKVGRHDAVSTAAAEPGFDSGA